MWSCSLLHMTSHEVTDLEQLNTYKTLWSLVVLRSSQAPPRTFLFIFSHLFRMLLQGYLLQYQKFWSGTPNKNSLTRQWERYMLCRCFKLYSTLKHNYWYGRNKRGCQISFLLTTWNVGVDGDFSSPFPKSTFNTARRMDAAAGIKNMWQYPLLNHSLYPSRRVHRNAGKRHGCLGTSYNFWTVLHFS